MFDAKESAAAIKAKSRKEIIPPNLGVPIIIRKLHPYDYIAEPGMREKFAERLAIPTAEISATSSGPQPAARDFAFEYEYMTHIAKKGVITPRVVDSEIPGDDEVSILDLASDLTFIAMEILKFSGLIDEAKVVDSFREGAAEKPADG
jgi:hypothetical protein